MDYKTETAKASWYYTKIISTIVFGIFGLIILGMIGCPRYNVWQQGLEGQAELARAKQNRQIVVEQSRAKEEAATFEAGADTIRAHGVARSNQIIGTSLKQNNEYLQWLWITEVSGKDVQKEVIYVPTEAKIPIMEAGRLTRQHEIEQTDPSVK